MAAARRNALVPGSARSRPFEARPRAPTLAAMRHTLFTQPDVLSPAECLAWITAAERRGFTDAPITTARGFVHAPEVRNNTRVMLDDPAAAGRLQQPTDERVAVVDRGTRTVLFNPPPAEQLPARLIKMCRFANGEIPAGQFLHPVVRAVMLHFWLAYDHPFEDGNGRTARALFYWAMLRAGYWLFEYVSISSILKKAFAQYGKSYLHSESDENDATYFLIHQLEVMLRAIDNLDEYLQRKLAQIRAVEARLKNVSRFNHRQLALLGHALRHPGTEYTIKSHQRSHNVAYATARSDLLALSKAKLVIERRIGAKTMTFIAPEDLEVRLAGQSNGHARRQASS